MRHEKITDEGTERHVRIGQVKIGRPGQSLTAILGSCVGIGFLHRKRQIYGLSHCLLSNSETDGRTTRGKPPRRVRPDGVGNGRHVDEAIQSLLAMMEIEDSEKRDLRVILAGGANMSLPADTPPEKLVGSVNAKFARKAIRAAGLRLLEDDLGGTNGRKISIDCTTGEYLIADIPRLGGPMS